MALRVLLADESHTIKKVFQLALQDYAVDVQPVNVGVDVLPVAKRFQPDIIFADVLLQKKNGYDVSAELKQDANLQNIPVVLMWSGFMDLDEDKYQASQANAYLEKPFAVNALRDLVHQFVPKTKTQTLSKYLDFPTLPDFQEDQASAKLKSPGSPQVSANSELSTEESWSMDQFEPMETTNTEDEEFKAVPLPPIKNEATDKAQTLSDEQDAPLNLLTEDEEDGAWAQKDLAKYKAEHNADTGTDIPVNYMVPENSSIDENEGVTLEPASEFDNLEIEIEDDPEVEMSLPKSEAHSTMNATKAQALEGLTAEKLEEIIRQEAKSLIEDAIWKVVPELAEQIIERELKKLLNEEQVY